MAISLVSKMFGSGLQVDRQSSSNTANVYVPHPPPPTHGEGYPYHSPPPFLGTWENPIGMGVKKKKAGRPYKGKGRPAGASLLLGKNSPFNSIPILGDIL